MQYSLSSHTQVLGAMRQLWAGLAKTHVFRLPRSNTAPLGRPRHQTGPFPQCQPRCAMCARRIINQHGIGTRHRQWDPCNCSSSSTEAAATCTDPVEEQPVQRLNVIEVLRSRGLVQASLHLPLLPTGHYTSCLILDFALCRASCSFNVSVFDPGYHKPCFGEGRGHRDIDCVLRV